MPEVNNVLIVAKTVINTNNMIAVADAVPKDWSLKASRYKYITIVIASSLVKALVPKKMVGSENNCSAPTVDVKTVKMINGFSIGMVMYISC